MQYLHPSTESQIVDNSFVFQVADGTTALFQVIRSATGADNVLTKVTSPTEYLFKFGYPSLTKYGQAAYNAIQWLKAGGALYVLRILPSDATFSIGGIKAELVKEAGTNGNPDNIQLALCHMSSLTGINSKTAITSAITANTTIAANRATVTLGLVHPVGRGKGYDGLGFQLGLRNDLDNTYGFRTYNFFVTALDNYGKNQYIEGPFLVSLDPEAINKNRESLYWATVINKYSRFVKVTDNRSAFDQITNFLLQDKPDVNPASVDILFGTPRLDALPTDYENLEWVLRENSTDLSTALTSVTVDDLYRGNAPSVLRNGSDGTMTGGNSEDALLIRAYTGLTDPSVLDKTFNEFDILLDANHSPPVKAAIGSLASDLRGDCLAIVDLGFQANEEQTLTYRKTAVDVSHRNVAIFAQDVEVYDEYNGENIKVTTPWLLASKIPEIDAQYGIQYPFVGPRRGIVSGFENINFIPNPTWKEAFYKAQINYIEQDPRKKNFATQLTSQAMNSALSNINNMRSVLRIERDVNKMMADYRMEFFDSITYESANYDLANYLAQWVSNRACTTATGYMYASDYDKQQKIARVLINLQFTGVMERIAIQIVIDR
jgi:hypothetical protein